MQFLNNNSFTFKFLDDPCTYLFIVFSYISSIIIYINIDFYIARNEFFDFYFLENFPQFLSISAVFEPKCQS